MDLLVNGLITGAVFAIAATGLVVTYSTSGVFNFAHGALGMFSAYLYWDLRVNPDHPWGVMPAPLALAVVLLVAAPLIGAVLYLGVIRRLQGTPEIVKLVVPISVLLALIGLANWIWKTDRPHTIQPFFGSGHKVEVLGAVLLWHDVTVLVVAVLLAIGLRLLLYRTRTGVAMRAVVDDRPLLELTGGRPDRVSLVSWMLGVSLSALAGILITPFMGGSLSSTLLTLLVINAFAAAMFGRLRNLPLTFLGALVLGLATRMAFERPTGLMPKTFDWRGNLRLAVPMLLLFAVLVVLPQDRLRGAVITRTRERFTFPSMRSTGIGAAVFIAGTAMASRLMVASDQIVLGNALGAGVIALSLVLLVGYAGEVSLATMAFAGLGGTVFFHHVGHGPDARAGVMAFVVAMVATALVGAVVALPALRLRGLYMALATAAFSLGVEQMVFKELSVSRRIQPVVLVLVAVAGMVAVRWAIRGWGLRGALVAGAASLGVLALAATNPWLRDERWSTIFPSGNLQVPRPHLLGIDFAPQSNYVLLLTVVLALLGVLLIVLRRSAYGRRLTAMKNSPAACATLGLNIVRLKLSVFMLSAAIAGLGGCLYAAQLGAVTADRFSLFESMALLMLLVVAGAGYVSGGITAGLLYAAVFVVLGNVLTKLAEDHPALDGPLGWLAQLTLVLPAFIGIGLGRDPSGFLDDVFRRFRALLRDTPQVFVAGLVVVVAGWFLAFQEVIGNWTFVLVTVAVLLVAPRIGERRVAAAGAGDWTDTPLDRIGLDRPFTADDVREIDRVVGVEGRSR